MRPHPERCRLHQEARFASVGCDRVDQRLDARPNALREKSREEQKELGLRKEEKPRSDNREEHGVDEQDPVGADEAHPEKASRHDDDTERELPEDHLDADRRGGPSGFSGMSRHIVDAPPAEAGETAGRESPPEPGDHDGTAQEAPRCADPLPDEQSLPAHRAETDRDELHGDRRPNPAPAKVAQLLEELLGAVAVDHLPKNVGEHADGKDELQREESELFRVCAHGPPSGCPTCCTQKGQIGDCRKTAGG